MRKLLLTLVLIVMGISAQARFYAGGTLGIDVINLHDGASDTQTALGIAPEVGYNINDTWAIGAQIGFGVVSNGSSITSVKIMPYVRNTFASVGMVDFFGELGMGYANQSSGGFGESGFVSAVRPGMAINFSKKFAVIARTNLLRYEYWDGVGVFEFALNKSFDLGVQFTF